MFRKKILVKFDFSSKFWRKVIFCFIFCFVVLFLYSFCCALNTMMFEERQKTQEWKSTMGVSLRMRDLVCLPCRPAWVDGVIATHRHWPRLNHNGFVSLSHKRCPTMEHWFQLAASQQLWKCDSALVMRICVLHRHFCSSSLSQLDDHLVELNARHAECTNSCRLWTADETTISWAMDCCCCYCCWCHCPSRSI